jgi:hypothetical protein
MTIYNPLKRSATRSMNRGDSKVEQFADGYDRRGMPIKDHPYHHKTIAELDYISRDAHKAAEANHPRNGGDPKVHNKYLDQVNDAQTILHYRRAHNVYGVRPKPPADAKLSVSADPKVEFALGTGPGGHPDSYDMSKSASQHPGHAGLIKAGYKYQGSYRTPKGTEHMYHHPTLPPQTLQHGAKLSVSAGAAMDPAVKKVKTFADSGIQNPNSSGQGHHADHDKHPFHETITKAGWKYSHSTPVTVEGVKGVHHTYKHPSADHSVGVRKRNNGTWGWDAHHGGSSHEVNSSDAGRLTSYLNRKSSEFKTPQAKVKRELQMRKNYGPGNI